MEFTGIARTFYILTVNLRFFCGFSVNLRAIDGFFTRFTVLFPGTFAAGEMPRDLKKRGISRQQIFQGIYRKSRKNVNWP